MKKRSYSRRGSSASAGGTPTSLGMVAAAGGLAFLLMIEVARLTVANAVAQDDPNLALRLAPQAPPSLTAAVMRQIGMAAAAGGNPDQQTSERLQLLARSAPLQIEPFLVEAALADRRGDYPRALQLLRQAKMRDPRSIAAHFLTGDVAMRQGNVVGSLEEVAVLSRLVPGTSVQMVPGLAQFAKTPGAREKLAGILAENPQLKGPLLTALAADADNADLIVALAGPRNEFNPDTRAWQSRLLGALADRGEYQRAYTLWRGFAGIQSDRQSLLFNGEFSNVPASPPFNWSLSSSPQGVSELGSKALRVLYYGRQDADLAWQTTLLSPGTYRFNSTLSGSLVPGALSWTLTCIGGKGTLLNLPLQSGPQVQSFTVPPSGCVAQKLTLTGHLQDSPQDSDVQIGPVAIVRAAS